MVHRQLAPAGGIAHIVAAIGTILLLAALAAAPAGAANRRIEISDYRWSEEDVAIQAGEHVTWHFTGPDLMHSVTGESQNVSGLDSDPGVNQPMQKLGRSYRVDFSQPGIYNFTCKLHTAVSGSVIVGPGPGDPVTEPDPIPDNNIDLVAPRLSSLRLGKPAVRRGSGVALRYSLDERARIEADFFRFEGEGKRRFSGFQTFRGFIGINSIGLGAPDAKLRLGPGRYLAVLRATDGVANESDPRYLRLRVLPKRG